jgi:hypothetical protein
MLRSEGTSGKFTGVAIVRCKSAEEANRLIGCLDGLEIEGRRLAVDFKKKREDNSSPSSGPSSDIEQGIVYSFHSYCFRSYTCTIAKCCTKTC